MLLRKYVACLLRSKMAFGAETIFSRARVKKKPELILASVKDNLSKTELSRRWQH